MRAFLKAVGRGVASGAALAIGTAAAAAAPPTVHALKDTTFFFRAQDGSILTLLMLEFLAARPGAGPIPGGGQPTYVGAATAEESGRRGEDLPRASARAVPLEFSLPATGEGATFFGRVYLKSGRNYTLRYVVNDKSREAIYLKNAVVDVPYLTGGFSASSVVPAERFGPADATAGPFHVGSEEVVPKAGGVFRRSELLRLYLQVYDAARDTVTSARRVDVVFRFYRVVKSKLKRHGKPFSVRAAAGPSMGLALPIGDWPTGSYRVVVELHDRISQARTSTEGSFSIVEE